MLISNEYRALIYKLREGNPRWGSSGGRHVQTILHKVLDDGRWNIRSALDYGCGYGVILGELCKINALRSDFCYRYDPGIPEYSNLPDKADLVISTDVLEHIEPDLLDNVLEHIASLHNQVAYLCIHTKHANEILPDGRNAHLTQKPPRWWHAKLEKVYKDVAILNSPEDDNIRPAWVCQ